jgi:hypothetical protein
MAPDRMVAERIARLTLAKSFILEAIKTSQQDVVLHAVSQGYRDVITNNLTLTQDENYTKHHQLDMDVRMLSPLKYPGQDLLAYSYGAHPTGDPNRFPDIFHAIMSPTHRGEMISFINESEASAQGQIMELTNLLRRCDEYDHFLNFSGLFIPRSASL